MEIIIAIAIVAIIGGIAAVGINGYFDSAERMERTEIAETAFYSIQSHVNYLKRNGQLEEFEQQLITYNEANHGEKQILTEAENKQIVEANCGEENAASYYANDYYPAHEKSQFLYVTIDKTDADKKNNPLYGVLAASFKSDDVMSNSFLVEYDMGTGVVRSVFYSEYADELDYAFSNPAGAGSDNTDCILRDENSIARKKQGYCGVLFTSRQYTEVVRKLEVADTIKLVNGDRLYLTWAETNHENPVFIDGTYQMDALYYVVNLYNQRNEMIASYELERGDMQQVGFGRTDVTEAEVLDYLDDNITFVADTMPGSTKTAGVCYADLSYENSSDGIAGEHYFMLLECLDHPFVQNGYDFTGEDRLYATLEVGYGENGAARGEAGPMSNIESVYYAYTENQSGNEEYGIACNRHLWNIRNGKYDGTYRLLADLDWGNVENRNRVIPYTSIVFKDENILGQTHGLEGSFDGKRPAEDTLGGEVLYDCYEIKGIMQEEPNKQQVGLFASNLGAITNVVLKDCQVTGAYEVGTLVGYNNGIVENVCVLNTTVSADYYAGGVVGAAGSASDVKGVVATTGPNKITANHTVGGVVGLLEGSLSNASAACHVESVLPEEKTSIYSTDLGKYVGGVVGRAVSEASAQYLYSGVLFDDEGALQAMRSKQVQAVPLEGVSPSKVTAIGYQGGVIGAIEGTGTFEYLYNYTANDVLYVSAAERAERGDGAANKVIHQNFGGVAGYVGEGATLKNSDNYTETEVRFVAEGQPMSPQEVSDAVYQTNFPLVGVSYTKERFSPLYIGGVVGANHGTVEDCTSKVVYSRSLQEEIDLQNRKLNLEDEVYLGHCVGGLVGYNYGELVFTDAYPDTSVDVAAYGYLQTGGLVGCLGSEGKIENRTGRDITVKGAVASGIHYAAGVAAYMEGGTLSGSFINDCFVFGEAAGGIAGYVADTVTIEACTNTGFIVGRGMYTSNNSKGWLGGIAAWNAGTLTDCENSGTVTCYLAAQIPDVVMDYRFGYAGGVAGYNTGTVRDCVARQNAAGDNYVAVNHNWYAGGLVGYNDSTDAKPATIVTTKGQQEITIDVYVGKDSDNYARRGDTAWQIGGIVGSANGSFSLKNYTYNGDISVQCAVDNRNFKSGVGGIIGYLQKNQEIVACEMLGRIDAKHDSVGGLVGCMQGGIVHADNRTGGSARIKGDNYVGGIVGYMNNTADGDYIYLNENLSAVEGDMYVGGLVGYVSGQNSVFDMSNRSNVGNVTGKEYVGGIVGACNSAAVTTHSLAGNRGTISGENYVGGIIGYLSSSSAHFTLANCNNYGLIYQSSANGAYHGGVVGYLNADVYVERCGNYNKVLPRDDSCFANYVGGIIGGLLQDGEFRYCVSTEEVMGNERVGGMLGNGACRDGVYWFDQCENKSPVIATTGDVGGLAGYLSCTSSDITKAPGTVRATNCTNNALVGGKSSVGGLFGHIENAVASIEYSHNLHMIGSADAESYHATEVGGLIGDLAASSVERANNTPQSRVFNSTNQADIVNSKTNVGGFVGRTSLPLLIESSTSGKIDMSNKITSNVNVENMGGMVGLGYWNYCPQITICSSSNYMNVETAADNTLYVGGLIGRTFGELYIGRENQPATYCQNYGKLDNTSGELMFAGGFVGHPSGKECQIYGAVNYGDMGSKSVYIRRAGGIIGNGSFYDTNKEMHTVVLRSCFQEGTIYNAYEYVGGIIGYSEDYCIDIDSCENKKDIYISGGENNHQRIGGIIGGANCDKNNPNNFAWNINMTRTNNYGNLIMDTDRLLEAGGGLVGWHVMDITIGSATDAAMACHNYGDIIGYEGMEMRYIGGIIGHTQQPSIISGKVEIYNATNNGDIGENARILNYSGGIVGYCLDNALLRDVSMLANIYNANDFVGGIIGRYEKGNLYMHNAVNGRADGTVGNIYGNRVENSDYVGGMIGYILSNKMVGDEVTKAVITKGINYGDFVLGNGKDLTVYNTGGLVGGAAYWLTLGDMNDADLGCVNYGDIYCSADNIIANAGGLVGSTEYSGADGKADALFIYNCRNQGNIGETNARYTVRTGGIVGLSACPATIAHTDNLGSIRSARENVGGIIGYNEQHALNLSYCQNGSSSDEGAGHIYLGTDTVQYVGGIIGRSYTSQKVGTDGNGEPAFAAQNTFACTNYGDITIGGDIWTAGYIGGIIGQGFGPDMCMDKAVNYGAIFPDGVTGQINSTRIGGIAGEFIQPDNSAELVEAQDISKVRLDGCENYGTIGKEDHTGPAVAVGGIAGIANGTVTNCVNHATIFAGIEQIGGVVGQTGGQARKILISNCVNEGEIRPARDVDFVGGIVGFGKEQNYEIHVQIMDCVNRGNLVLKDDCRNTGIGGVLGHRNSSYGNVVRNDLLEIVGCENYGDIINGYFTVGGIVSSLNGQTGAYLLMNCTNYGNIICQADLIDVNDSTNVGVVGGIAGAATVNGGIMHCINAGDVSGVTDVSSDRSKVGGLLYSIGSNNSAPYIVDCYQLGSVHGFTEAGLIRTVNSANSYIMDCYALGDSSTYRDGLLPSLNMDELPETVLWQVEDSAVGKGYFTRNVFERMCGKLGLDPNNWSDTDMVANAKYLISAYSYQPDDPVASNFVYQPAAETGTENKISWNIQDINYLIAAGMEIALYPTDLSDEEILADVLGELAYISLTANFAGARLPDSASVVIEESQLPIEETSYRVVTKTLGYSFVSLSQTEDGATVFTPITQDTERVLSVEILTLPAQQPELLEELQDELLSSASDSDTEGDDSASDNDDNADKNGTESASGNETGGSTSGNDVTDKALPAVNDGDAGGEDTASYGELSLGGGDAIGSNTKKKSRTVSENK